MLQILNEYIVFIVFFFIGLSGLLISPLILSKIDNTTSLSNLMLKKLVCCLLKTTFYLDIIMVLFKISGTMFTEIYAQIAIMFLINISFSELLIMSIVNDLKHLTEEDAEKYSIKQKEFKKASLISPLFIFWMFLTIFLGISTYIVSLVTIKTIAATVALSFIIFVLNLFVGIDLIHSLNKILDKNTMK